MKSLLSCSEERRKNRAVSTFLKKTYQLLNNGQHEDCIRWALSGIGFVILNQELFAKIVLPKYFKHSNYSSFVRQLNMYNFHKIRENSQESYFHHECFTSNDRDALALIKRKPEKKKKKNNESDSEACISQQKTKKFIKNQKPYFFQSQKEASANSLKKVESEKITQNMFDQEGNCEMIRIPMNDSSDQLSMQVEEEQKIDSNRRLPGVPTRELISASKNNIIPMSVSVENIQTSILSIFY